MPKPTLAAPPHRYAGHYTDRVGARFVVPSTPAFALFRADAEGHLLTPDSPLHRSETEFTASLGFGTFQKLA